MSIRGHKCKPVSVGFSVPCECGWRSSTWYGPSGRSNAYREWYQHAQGHEELIKLKIGTMPLGAYRLVKGKPGIGRRVRVRDDAPNSQAFEVIIDGRIGTMEWIAAMA